MSSRKIITFILLAIFFISIFTIKVNSQLDSSGVDSLRENLDKANEIKENLTDEEIRSEYLKGEWTKALEKSSSGRILVEISNIFKVLSPLFKLFLGVEYSLSWFFILSLILGIFFFIVIFRVTKNIIQLDTFIAVIVSLALLGFAGLTGVIRNVVLFFEPLFTNGITIFIAAAAITTIIFLSSNFLKKLGKYMQEKKKKEKENMREQKEEIKDKMDEIRFKGGNYNRSV